MNTSFKKPPPSALLFDLDGTLADTAPDLAAAVNLMRTERHLEPAPFTQLRAHASGGARGLLYAGFGITPDDAEFEAMRLEFLANYEAAICQHSCLFDGIAELLRLINARGIPWGIVTNKMARFTQPLIPLLGLQNAHCIISGDTTPHYKPHPAPLLEAAKQLHVAAQDCYYVGDDLRDIQAANAAGMTSIAAAWGYNGQAEPQNWSADLLLHLPGELIQLIS